MKKFLVLFVVFFLLLTVSARAASAFVFNNSLKVGMTSQDVRELQKFLNSKGFIVAQSGNGSPGNETTYFGNRTESAVILFQKANNLVPDGKVGPLTRSVVNAIDQGVNLYSPSPSTSTYLPGCTATTTYSITTGQLCSVPAGTAYPSGCTATTKYSITTGQLCAYTSATYSTGCSSASGYSITTGRSCSSSTVSRSSGGGGGGGGGDGGGGGGENNNLVTISTSTISGIIAPVTGAAPSLSINSTDQYTATITWNGNPSTFSAGTIYAATITITPKSGYTLDGVPSNFFTVSGAIMAANNANSGVVAAIFPETEAVGGGGIPITINLQSISGVTVPVTGATPVLAISATPQYTATISWSPTAATFAAGTAYTASINITPKTGYTLTIVPANFFIVAGATTTNSANSGIVSAVFPATVGGETSNTKTVTVQGTFYENFNTQAYVCGSRAMDIYNYQSDGKPYLFMINGCGIDVYDANGVKAAAAYLAPGRNGYLHYDYKLHHVALLDNFPYGVASYSTEGWTVFKINKGTAGKITGLQSVKSFYVGDNSGSTNPAGMINAMGLFKVGSRAYLISRYDMNPDDGQEASFAIYDFGDGTADPTLTKVAEISPRRSSTIYNIIADGGKTYLYVYGSESVWNGQYNANVPGLFIYDVTIPTSPVYLGKKNGAGFSFLSFSYGEQSVGHPKGTAYAPAAKRLYTFPAKDTFYIYDVSDPKNPILKASQSLPSGVTNYGNGIASDGKLLAVVVDKKRDSQNNILPGSQMVYYYDVQGDQPKLIPSNIPYSTASSFATGNSAQDIALVPPQSSGTEYRAFRSYWMQAFWDKITI
ncbi:MAG: hypothetical protein UV76_C0009G0009 [Candidatus Nomurabacteria bacterium GW2011_GWA2_43_15]|uniref:Peptidoglycan binding-like domain-containing protein n=2 Tax=Candidatus Nomuraibacteriota TaxID=1752729 RepID=A0A0G1DSB2_9BACT|nr:MAG: hypothetical protein UV76_C0009G0009 [Candidatus Nomurabacteria bacterium GW2011_GWA2_43_15]